MRIFLFRFLLFLLPFFLLIPVELHVRENTFKAKSELIEEGKNEIELLLLGSSQLAHSVNPEFIRLKTASLAIDGSALDIDYLLFQKYFSQLKEIKAVVIELSYHSMFEIRGEAWAKNHLLLNYFQINNYGTTPSVNQHFLISAQPQFYLRKLLQELKYKGVSHYNKYGFIDKPLDTAIHLPITRFRRLSYDEERIQWTSQDYLSKISHFSLSTEPFEVNAQRLRAIRDTCEKYQVQLIFVSPPKHQFYNQKMEEKKLEMREEFLHEMLSNKIVHFLNYETDFEKKTRLFDNENHMNIKGAEIFTKKISAHIDSLRR